jgi:hypothetical protein
MRDVRKRDNRVGDQTDLGESAGEVCEGLRYLQTCELACAELQEEASERAFRHAIGTNFFFF